MKIDAHQHFWKIGRGDYGWLTPDLPPLYRDYGPQDLEPTLAVLAIDGTIAVQAAPTVAETEFLLSIYEECDFVFGVVGWVDFESGSAKADIDRLAGHDGLVGLRPMIQDIPDPDWMLQPKLETAFAAMIEQELTFDALVLPHHLKPLTALVERYPDLRVIIDHGAKPRIEAGETEEWASGMRELAGYENVFCKLSGLVTEASAAWTVEDLQPFVDHLISAFGSGRLIWGSDWPVCTQAAAYDDWWAATQKLIRPLTDDQKSNVLGGNAIKAYGLTDGGAP